MGLNPEYVRYFMVPDTRPSCPTCGVPMEDGDKQGQYFCVLCTDKGRSCIASGEPIRNWCLACTTDNPDECSKKEEF